MDNGDALQVIKRYESGNYASNDTCMKHYVAALVESKRLYQTNLSQVLNKNKSGGGRSGGGKSGGGFGDFYEDKGSDDQPLIVALQVRRLWPV